MQEAAINPTTAVAFRDMVVKGHWAMEAKNTAEVIRRIPADKTEFKPHEKSTPMGQLARHIFNSEAMFVDGLCDGKFDYQASMKKLGEHPADPKKLADQYVQWQEGAVARLMKLTPEQLVKPIQFHPSMPAMPAFQYLGWMTSHTIHHRAQLTVYLRLTGAKVPAIYGGSADENPFAAK
ncbi:MAG: DinB family protein [Planctomycetota bacterium]